MKKVFVPDILPQLNSDYKNENHSYSQLDKRDASRITQKHPENCPHCGSANLSTGAGLKPGQMSLRCGECKRFIGYRNLEKLQRLRRRKSLTPCLELLEKQGIKGDVAIFVLSAVGGEANG